MFLDCRQVCKTCAFHDALQAGKQKLVHGTPLIWRLQAQSQQIFWLWCIVIVTGDILIVVYCASFLMLFRRVKEKLVRGTPLIWRLEAQSQQIFWLWCIVIVTTDILIVVYCHSQNRYFDCGVLS
jgi:hypothetical protein